MESSASSGPLFRGRRPKGAAARTKTVGGAFSPDEQKAVHAAMETGGFTSPADGVRSILFAYQLSTEVRDAVARAKPLVAQILKKSA